VSIPIDFSSVFAHQLKCSCRTSCQNLVENFMRIRWRLNWNQFFLGYKLLKRFINLRNDQFLNWLSVSECLVAYFIPNFDNFIFQISFEHNLMINDLFEFCFRFFSIHAVHNLVLMRIILIIFQLRNPLPK
jgi:hypothetical protein